MVSAPGQWAFAKIWASGHNSTNLLAFATEEQRTDTGFEALPFASNNR
jgi:hypothetical protein